ncbi:MAG TPA: GNAT family N-acetyltransferase [Pyrinomonadaceae bacterium]
MEIGFALLAQRPTEIPRIARWWCDEWGLPERHSTFSQYVRELEGLALDALPAHLIAESAGRAIGVATLKVKVGHGVIPGHSHWLSGVFVEPSHRRNGVAAALCEEIMEVARRRGVTRLYLQTEHLDGGLYARLGWVPVQRHREGGLDQLIMVRDPEMRRGAGGT